MSVVFFGAFVAQVIGMALMGLILLLVGALLYGASARSWRGLIREQSPLPIRWLDVAARLLAGWTIPTAPRAPPGRPPGPQLRLQPIPVSTFAYRRRRSKRPNDLP